LYSLLPFYFYLFTSSVNLIQKGKALKMAMIQPDYNMVHLLCIIFSQGISQDNPSCKKFTDFLISSARSRGYHGDIIPVFKEDLSSSEMVRSTADLASYICVNDIREMFMANRSHHRVIIDSLMEIDTTELTMN